jgi:hypothetical protein
MSKTPLRATARASRPLLASRTAPLHEQALQALCIGLIGLRHENAEVRRGERMAVREDGRRRRVNGLRCRPRGGNMAGSAGVGEAGFAASRRRYKLFCHRGHRD